jgi:hypothetical protein
MDFFATRYITREAPPSAAQTLLAGWIIINIITAF